MLMLHLLAEQRIEEAMREGAFDNLPGAGKPLDLDDDRLVPEELRAAYRLLKNAGFVPPELETHREIADLKRWIACLQDEPDVAREATRDCAYARLCLLQAKLDAKGRGALARNDGYRARLLARFSRTG